ncbi:hypothetical protein BGX38DRAFT_100976 [Terfezia claveryi]|nr:hypothetical protein BGX38DRAFT_100976 [Terfezia claveryi]
MGSSKVLLESNDEGGVKRRRQFALEKVTQSHMAPEIGENGSRALLQAWSNMEKSRKEWTGKDDWDHHVSQQERLGREDEEVFRVKDGSLVESDIEILARGIVIQDGSVNGHLEGFDFTYEEAENEEVTLESITVRPMRPDGSVFGMTNKWALSTSNPARRKGLQGFVAQDLARFEARMEGIQEGEESENDVKRRKSARNGKKPRLEGHLTLGDLEEELGGGLNEPITPRKFEESLEYANHMVSPSQEKDYSCPNCSGRYKYQKDVVRHMTTKCSAAPARQYDI